MFTSHVPVHYNTLLYTLLSYLHFGQFIKFDIVILINNRSILVYLSSFMFWYYFYIIHHVLYFVPAEGLSVLLTFILVN